MTAENWQAVCAVTLDYEGGNDDDPRDPGGRTSRGITQREYDVWRQAHPGLASDVWRAPQATIVDIYKTEYWDKCDGDAFPIGVDLCVYDAAVNSGLGKGLAWGRKALADPKGDFAHLALDANATRDRVGAIHRYQAARVSFLEGLRTWGYFGRGWGARVAGIEAIATKWTLAAQGIAPAPVLVAKGKAARDKKNGATGSIPAAAAPAVAHVSTAVHSSPLDYVLTGCVVLGTLLAVAYLLHLVYVQRARSQAFSSEALKT